MNASKTVVQLVGKRPYKCLTAIIHDKTIMFLGRTHMHASAATYFKVQGFGF